MTSPDTMALKGHTVTDLNIPEAVMRDILDASGMIADPARRARFAAKRAAAWGYLRAVADASLTTVHMQTQTEGER